jgi:hypothetical protein
VAETLPARFLHAADKVSWSSRFVACLWRVQPPATDKAGRMQVTRYWVWCGGKIYAAGVFPPEAVHHSFCSNTLYLYRAYLALECCDPAHQIWHIRRHSSESRARRFLAHLVTVVRQLCGYHSPRFPDVHQQYSASVPLKWRDVSDAHSS